jgi:hypothetical protein
MNFNEIIKNYSEEKKETIIELSKINKKEMQLNNLYNDQALNFFFDLWHQHFPNVKQQKSCAGCRQSVIKFFENVASFLEEEKITK